VSYQYFSSFSKKKINSSYFVHGSTLNQNIYREKKLIILVALLKQNIKQIQA